MTLDTQSAASQCLTDELLVELIDGQLAWEKLSWVHLHAANCSACHDLLVTLARGGLGLEHAGALHSLGPEGFSRSETSGEISAPTWAPPMEFDEFRLERELGRGAMGVIYLAYDRSLDRQVAVKFIAAPHPSSQLREHFKTEARAIARLQHPNIVTVFRVGEIDGHPYIVSEHLAGQSLAHQPLPLPWRRALVLGLELARGLAAAHRQGVLHRDLKPSNIFLTTAGEVKLLDFGLAELVDAKRPAGAGGGLRVPGTPRYMAPELMRGEPASPRSDVYALGLILYELCTNTLPPLHRSRLYLPQASQGVFEVTDHLENGSGLTLTTCAPGIDPDFALLIERCLRVNPSERFASAEVLSAALERLHEPGVLATGNPYRGLAPFEAEHRWLFFGRDTDIRAVLERLRRQPLVLVAGDSGVGKSSLCRAGILPRVTQGMLDEHRDFHTLTLEPGPRPLAALAAALAPVLSQPEADLARQLVERPAAVGVALRAAHQKRRGLLLFVDQLEELFTLSEPVQAACFASVLGELALPAAGLRVLLTLRGDFLTRLCALPTLGSEIERALYLLRPLSSTGVREAIVGPARSQGVVFESEALVQALVDTMVHSMGSLPLLQFALAELWECRDPAQDCITQAALDKMGGVAGALSRHADGILAQLDQPTQQAARRLLCRLITADGTRGCLSGAELTAASDEAPIALRALVRGRLLHARTTNDQVSYEIAHEALIVHWGTLRRWLDEDAGQRALRQRIETASAEWERLGRTADLLWRKRQLDEVRALEPIALAAREREFLHSSQRAVSLQRLYRWSIALLLLLGGTALYGGPRLKAQLETQRFVRAQLATVQKARTRAQVQAQRARVSRARALALFDGRGASMQNAQDLRPLAEEAWSQALKEYAQVEAGFIKAEQELAEVLARAPENRAARQLLIELLYEHLELAEHFHRPEEPARLVAQLKRLEAQDTALLQRLEAPARLEIETQPPGATIELTRYVDDGDGLRREPVPAQPLLSPTPITQLSLPAGSYQLRVLHEGHVPVELPLWLERGQFEHVRLTLLPRVPEGYVYIPRGCFFMGSADPEALRKFLLSAPLARRCLKHDYLIGKTEVTLGDWLEYLDTLPEEAPQRRNLATLHEGISHAFRLWKLPDGAWSFSLRLENEEILTARAGEPLRYPGRRHRREQDWRRFPLTGITAEELQDYLTWLDRTGQLPGARFCSELEWTRAASGADYRRFPHGNQLAKGDANIDETYDQKSDAMGPDEVDAYPASMSPFGLLGMAGNAFEMTRPVTSNLDGLILRGGAWYYGEVGAWIANRQDFTAKSRDFKVGVRLCAPIFKGENSKGM